MDFPCQSACLLLHCISQLIDILSFEQHLLSHELLLIELLQLTTFFMVYSQIA
jgi:hypothetical protein